jgi:hypothetical protein
MLHNHSSKFNYFVFINSRKRKIGKLSRDVSISLLDNLTFKVVLGDERS